jgi:hypothetical protein
MDAIVQRYQSATVPQLKRYQSAQLKRIIKFNGLPFLAQCRWTSRKADRLQAANAAVREAERALLAAEAARAAAKEYLASLESNKEK